jgi:hypothetical protein
LNPNIFASVFSPTTDESTIKSMEGMGFEPTAPCV